jgi:hypothetical protein
LDLLIEDRLVVELKSVDELLPIFDAQVLTYETREQVGWPPDQF